MNPIIFPVRFAAGLLIPVPRLRSFAHRIAALLSIGKKLGKAGPANVSVKIAERSLQLHGRMSSIAVMGAERKPIVSCEGNGTQRDAVRRRPPKRRALQEQMRKPNNTAITGVEIVKNLYSQPLDSVLAGLLPLFFSAVASDMRWTRATGTQRR